MASLVLSLLIVAALAGWAVLSAINQFSTTEFRRRPQSRAARLIWSVKRADVFSLLPIWTFFAPTPGTNDHNVLYRDELVDGVMTPWHLVCDNSTRWTCVLWNPHKRLKKALLDMSHGLLRSAYRTVKAKRNPKRMLVSLPYIGIATRVSSVDRGPLSARTQFMISISEGYKAGAEPKVLYISPLFGVMK